MKIKMKKNKMVGLALILAISIPLNVFAGTTLGTNLIVGDGTPTVTQDGEDAYIEGTFEVDGASRFDGSTTYNSTVTVGEDDTGYDVTFYGATSGASFLWDESADLLTIADSTTQFVSTSAGENGALMSFYQNSSSPAAEDILGEIYFIGKDSADDQELYGSIRGSIMSATDGSEQGFISFRSANGDGSASVAGGFAAIDAISTGILVIGDPFGGGYVDGMISSGPDGDLTIDLDGDGNIIMDGPVTYTVVTQTGAGAIPLSNSTVKLATTGADALTLADGIDGQEITIVMLTDGGDGTLTPATPSGYATITFDDVGDVVTLLYFDGAGWGIKANRGATEA